MARSPRGWGSANAESRRLVDGDGTSKERLLLQAGIADAPPSRAGRDRTLLALGILASVSTLASSTPAAAEVSRGLVAAHAKWLLFGVAGAAAAVGGVVLGPSPASVPSVAPSVAASSRAPSTSRASRPLAADVGAVPHPASASPSPSLSPPATRRDARAEGASSNERSTTLSLPRRDPEPQVSTEGTSAPSELVAQVAALDQARAALRAGRPRESVALLDRFDRRYPDSSLAPEATVVRVGALLTLGQRAQATRLVRSYCRVGGRDAYGQRLMALVGLDEAACEDSHRARDRSE